MNRNLFENEAVHHRLPVRFFSSLNSWRTADTVASHFGVEHALLLQHDDQFVESHRCRIRTAAPLCGAFFKRNLCFFYSQRRSSCEEFKKRCTEKSKQPFAVGFQCGTQLPCFHSLACSGNPLPGVGSNIFWKHHNMRYNMVFTVLP